MDPQAYESKYEEKKTIVPGQAEARLRLENRFKGGAGWFFWVAALSIVNSIIILAGGKWGFIFGLGVTQIVDGIGIAVSEGAPEAGFGIKLIPLGINLFIAGFVVMFGVLARQRHQWAFVVGMVLYALDGLILLAAGDILGSVFHGWVLFCLFSGLRACRQLDAMDSGVEQARAA